MRCLALLTLTLGLVLASSRPSRADTPPREAADAALHRAEDLVARADLEQAVEGLSRFVTQWPDDPRAPAALRDAITLWRGLGEGARVDDAISTAERLFSTSRPADFAEIVFDHASHLFERGDLREARRALEGLLRSLDRLPSSPDLREIELRADVRLARVLVSLGEDRRAAAKLADAEALGLGLGVWPDKSKNGATPRSQDTLECMAEVLYFAAERKRVAAERIELPPYTGKGDRDSVLAYLEGPAAKWTEKRGAAVEQAERAYVRVFGVEWKAPRSAPVDAQGGDPSAPWMREDSDPLSRDYPGPPPPSARFAMAAARRIGDGYAQLTHSLRVMPIPYTWHLDEYVRWARLPLMIVLDTPSETLHFRAKAAFETCMRISARYRIADEHTGACEDWLVRNAAAEHFTLFELQRGATWDAIGITPEPAGPLPPRIRTPLPSG